MAVDPDHLKFTHPIHLRITPALVQTAEEAIEWLVSANTEQRIKQVLGVVRLHLEEAVEHKSQKEADDLRDQMVRILDGMRLTLR